MNNITIFNGPSYKFKEIIPNRDICTFLELVDEDDSDRRTYLHTVPGQNDIDNKEKEYIKNLIIYSTDYASVNKHVILNFTNFLEKWEIENIYVQNPPETLVNNLYKRNKNIKIINHEYKKIELDLIKKIINQFSFKIIGQDSIKDELGATLYQNLRMEKNKPLVVMLYGESGVGKTESVKFIANLLEEDLFRKQFSMFQNEAYSTYLFGGKHNELSFAQELLERKSNIILLDEFDKSNNIFYSAFYQMFDEGILEDTNYKVNLQNSIIFCTSNYKTEDEIKKKLGEPIYSRFDSFIKFNSISLESRRKIINIQFEREYLRLSDKEKEIIDKYNGINEILDKLAKNNNNIRYMGNMLRKIIYIIIIRELNK